MAILMMKIRRTLKASSLIENLVASVLIIVVFMIASLSINNIFGNYIYGNDREVQLRISELSYLYVHGKISSGYSEIYKGKAISIEIINDSPFIVINQNNELLKTEEIVYDEY